MNKPRISERMRMIESMVLPGKPVADIGTDHGFVPADLLLRGVCPFALLTDINAGPLEKCRENLAMLGVDPSRYQLRAGDGFKVLKEGEVSTAIVAGMGGELIQSMFESVPFDQFRSEGSGIFERAVLQPRTHSDDLRSFLTSGGFRIVDYGLARERGRICEVFAVEPCDAASGRADCGLVSEFLLNKGDPLLDEFLQSKEDHLTEMISSVKKSRQEESRGLSEIFEAMLSDLRNIRSNI